MASVIDLENVEMKFDNLTVFKSVNLAISEGESFVIVGPSGQGKTVLLKLMCGLLNPTSGEIKIHGASLLSMKEREKRSILRSMGVLFQKNALFDSLSVAENIAFPLRETTPKDEKEIQGIVHRYLTSVAIGHAKDLFPDEISGGMQKRLGIARALALEPKIVFYDDPTAGLDPITSRNIVNLIRDLKKEFSSTIIAITNDMNRAYQLADRIGMVVQGELIITGSPEQTKNHSDPRVRQFIRGQTEGPLTEVNA